MSNKSNANRWVPFQCPLCYGLFRLKKGQIGSAGHCPTCQSIIKVGQVDDEISPTSKLESSARTSPDAIAEEEPAADLLEKVAVAKTMTPEELAEYEAERQSRKKRSNRGAAADKIDWEDEEAQSQPSGLSFFQICGGAMLLVLLLGIAMFYVKTRKKGRDSGREIILGDAKAKEALDKILLVDPTASYKNEDGIDTSVQLVNERQKIDLEKVEERVRAFLESKTVTSCLQYVREPERVKPLMMAFYGGEKRETEGFESLNKLDVIYHGNLLTTTVEMSDFLSSQIAVEKTGPDDDPVYQVDWESWVGHSDFSPQEMREKTPSEPFELRAVISVGAYYNYGFSDDDEWACYRLLLKDPEYSFLGYVEKDLELDRTFTDALKLQEKKRYLLKVKYPEDARAQDQLEIVGVVTEGWVSDSGEKEAKNDDE